MRREEAGGRAYRVRVVYSEKVRGEDRRFKNELMIPASDPEDACERASELFHADARESSVRWLRTLEEVSVLSGPHPVRSRAGRLEDPGLDRPPRRES